MQYVITTIMLTATYYQQSSSSASQISTKRFLSPPNIKLTILQPSKYHNNGSSNLWAEFIFLCGLSLAFILSGKHLFILRSFKSMLVWFHLQPLIIIWSFMATLKLPSANLMLDFLLIIPFISRFNSLFL